MLRKLLPVLLLLSAAPSVASAREPSGLWRLAVNYYRSLTAPKPYLDSACVYQPRLVWALGPDVNVIRAGVDLHSDITVTDLRDGNATQTGGTMDIGMRNHLCRKVGLDVAYGSLGLGYGVEVGNRGAARNTYFTFGITATCYGAQIQYFKTNQHASGSLALEGEAPVDLTTANPGQMRNLSLNAFYAFNRRRFVYNGPDPAAPVVGVLAGDGEVPAGGLFHRPVGNGVHRAAERPEPVYHAADFPRGRLFLQLGAFPPGSV